MIGRQRPIVPGLLPPQSRAPFRLDRLSNQAGPTLHVQEALAAADFGQSPAIATERLRHLIAGFESLPPSWVAVAPGIDELIAAIVRWRGQGQADAPAIVFDPTDESVARIAELHGMPLDRRARSSRLQVDVEPSDMGDVDPRSTAFVMSPNDPTGTLLSAQVAVRLSRACALLVVDERHGAYHRRSLLPLVREFEQIVVVKTLETWAGLSAAPIAYALSRPHVVDEIGRHLLLPRLPLVNLLAGVACFEDLRALLATTDRIREEKGRLYRTLRKLNMLRPLPSWSNFMLAQIERGSRETIAEGLELRGIRVAQPAQPILRETLRISAVSAEATQALKTALIEIALDL